MTEQALVQYDYTLVPKGETLSSADEKRMERIVKEYDDTLTTKQGVYQALTSQNAIDRYALRNYWDVIRLDCQYANPPWESWADFESYLSSLEHTLYVETHTFEKQFTAIISIKEGKETTVAAEIKNYFPPLNPIIKSGQITVCPEAPLTKLENKF